MALRRIVVAFDLSGWTKTGDKIEPRCSSRSEAAMDILTMTRLSGLEFLISICDLNGASLFTDVLFSWSCYLLWWNFPTSETTLCLFGQSLDADDLRFTRCQGLVHYLAGNWLVCIGRARCVNGTCMKWALGNRSNSAGIGLSIWLVAIVARPKHRDFTLSHHSLAKFVLC